MARKGLKRVRFTLDGKLYERTGKTLGEAHRKAADLRAKLERGENTASGNMSVRAWVDTWLETYKENSVGYGTYMSYKLYAGIIKDEIGSMRLRDVKDIHLQRIANMAAGKSKSYVSKLRITISAVFSHATASRLIPYNPADFKHLIKMPLAEEGIRRSITAFERSHILAVAAEHRAGLWLKLMLYAGLRPGECRALEWRHVDFNKRRISVESAVKASTSKIGKPKSKKSVRLIPIKNELCELLWEHRGDPFSSVLKNSGGERYTQSGLSNMWDSFKRQLDIHMGAKLYRNRIALSAVAPDLVAYCLRHTFCTDLQAAGVPLKVASYLMGHEDIRITANIYTDVTDEMIEDAHVKINLKGPDKRTLENMLKDTAQLINPDENNAKRGTNGGTDA